MTPHPHEEIQNLLDGRLDEARAAVLREHLEGCPACRAELEALRSVKAGLRGSRPEAPPDLLASLSSALDREDERLSAWRPTRRQIGALAAGVVIVLAVLIGRFFAPRAHDFMVEVDSRYHELRQGTAEAPPLELTTSDPAALERLFATAGITFPTRVFDLGMMGYHLLGGRTSTLAGRPAALFVYRSESGAIVLCAMYEGSLAELPPTSDVRVHAGIRFQVYRQDGRTLVFWQEGGVVCVLVSDEAPESVVQLGFAKAMLPAAPRP